MGISRESTAINRSFLGPFAAITAIVIVVLVQCSQDRGHEENVSNPQRLRAIETKINTYGGSCSNGNGSLTATTDIDGRSSVRYHDMMNKFSVGLDKTGTVVASQGDAKGPALLSPIGSHDIPKVLSFMEMAVGALCPDSPKNNTQPVQSSGSVALGFFEQGGRING